jgi:tetratricopeptide (TPR) repeat protein
MIAPRAPTPLAAPLAAALAVEPEEEVIDLRAEAVEVVEDFTLLELEPEAPLEAPAAARATHADLEDDLAHADFLVVHRFAHEARALLDDLEAAHPGHPGVTSLRARLDAGPERIRAHTPAPAAQATPALQLATPPPSPAAPPAGLEVHDTDLLGAVELVSAEEVLARFQEQVALAVSPGDAATHYDLGIAYREMGLVTEALAEFEQALGAATGPRAVDCLVAVSLCQSARGEHAKASRTLKRALAHPAITRAGAAAVLYELGAIRERAGDATGAASAYRAADRSQPHFRDAAARAERLQPGGGSPGTGPLDLLPSGA